MINMEDKKDKSTNTNINWFPGHMAKAKRQMEEQLKLVDIIIELRDARIPFSSENPLLKELGKNKKKLIILNKADLADEIENNKFLLYFDNVLLLDSLHQNINKIVSEKIKEICKDILDRAIRRGIKNKTIRAMVVGIPNVGKSTFINSFVKRKVAKVENRPGVTKNLQWIRIDKDIELLDTPGVLWPKFENQEDAIKLAILGTINDNILDKEELVNYCLLYLKDNYKDLLIKYYELDNLNNIFEDIGRKKNYLSEGGQIDKNKTIDSILKDIRLNKIGRISLEKVEDVRE